MPCVCLCRRRPDRRDPDLAGDPDNVNRDDLVFAGGSMHLISTILATLFSPEPHYTGRIGR